MAALEQPELSPWRLLQDVARLLDLDVATLRGRDRTTRVVDARCVATLLLRERCLLSYPAIGRELDRHHATAIRALVRLRSYSRTLELAQYVTDALDGRILARPVVDVEAAFRRAREDAIEQRTIQRVEALLRRALASGRRPSSEVKALLFERHGVRERDIKRALQPVGVVVERTPTVPPRTFWRLRDQTGSTATSVQAGEPRDLLRRPREEGSASAQRAEPG